MTGEAEASPLSSHWTRREPRFSYAVGALDRALRRQLGAVLEPFAVTIAEYTALSLLQDSGGNSNAELARKALVSPQAMNEVIQSLERRRIIRRSPSETHGSVLNTFLTTTGRKLLDRCDVAVDAMEAWMLDGVTADDGEDAVAMLMTCVRNLRDYLPDGPDPA
jgi:DNA-binding MarR family transcriptional regulator